MLSWMELHTVEFHTCLVSILFIKDFIAFNIICIDFIGFLVNTVIQVIDNSFFIILPNLWNASLFLTYYYFCVIYYHPYNFSMICLWMSSHPLMTLEGQNSQNNALSTICERCFPNNIKPNMMNVQLRQIT